MPIAERHWTERMVMVYLEEAAEIHRRLPEVRTPGFYSLWPDTLKDDWERLYDAVNGKARLGSPMPPDVSRSEEIMEWLQLLSRYEQKVVWTRANRIPWKILVEEFGKSKTTLWRDLNGALTRIAASLNARRCAEQGGERSPILIHPSFAREF